jgi:hypothetical protein
VSGYLLRVLIAIDQLGNAVLGGRPDQTISARCWEHRSRSRAHGLACMSIDLLFSSLGSMPQHCRRAYLAERMRIHNNYHTDYD